MEPYTKVLQLRLESLVELGIAPSHVEYTHRPI